VVSAPQNPQGNENVRIIPRYVLRHFLPVFMLALFTFTSLYLIVDFFENMEQFIEKRVPAADTIAYFLNKTPSVAAQGIPMAALLGALITLGLLKRNRELIALEAAGVKTVTYVTPIVAAAFFIAAFHLVFGETVSRSMNQASTKIWNEQVQHRKGHFSWGVENVWYHGQNVIYQVRFYDKRTQTLEKVSLFFLDPSFRLVQRLDARRFRWDGAKWQAEQGLFLKFSESGTQQETFDQRAFTLQETPADFSGLETIPEELDWVDLYRYAEKIRQEGYNSLPYVIELHLRVAFPLSAIVLAILGIIIALRQNMHGGIALGVGIGLLVGSSYFVVQQLGCALAGAGALPPVVGVWAANVIFLAAAVYLWISNPSGS